MTLLGEPEALEAGAEVMLSDEVRVTLKSTQHTHTQLRLNICDAERLSMMTKRNITWFAVIIVQIFKLMLCVIMMLCFFKFSFEQSTLIAIFA